jgi:hypothetical protein
MANNGKVQARITERVKFKLDTARQAKKPAVIAAYKKTCSVSKACELAGQR